MEFEGQWADPTDLQPVELVKEEKIKVVATTTIVGDVVSFIGGREIELTVLMPFEVDPHAYEPTSGDLRSLADANVIFTNGLGMEISLYDFLEPLLNDVPIISLSDGISLRSLESGVEDSFDPHVWFDPANVKHWVDRTSTALSRLNPAKRTTFEEHAETYKKFLDNLDRWIEETVDQLPADKRIIVSDHYIFGYFIGRYGFEMVGAVVPVFSSAAEPTAQEIASLEETISQLNVQVIFVGETFSSSIAQRIKEDTGIRLVSLYTGALSDSEGPAASYLNFMQYNVAEIVNALLE
jgi:ABC-type Zn uptake system ZnuABC Zn-binding protein ZnuA